MTDEEIQALLEQSDLSDGTDESDDGWPDPGSAEESDSEDESIIIPDSNEPSTSYTPSRKLRELWKSKRYIVFY